MRIYLDHNATSPLREETLRAMTRVLRGGLGNPSSVHAEGAAARAEVEAARERVAALVGARPREVVFTSGATEANNAALGGLLAREPGHLVTTAVEHPSVEGPAARLEAAGWRVTRVGVGVDGLLDPEAVVAALEPDTQLVSVGWANHETGVVQPLREIAERVRERGIRLHADASQALGRIPVDLRRVPMDWLSLSAHKLGGPPGCGCLVVREGAPCAPWLWGGPQERGLRAGTENVAGIAGFGAACERALAELPERAERLAQLRDRLWEGLRAKLRGVLRNGSPERVLPNTLSVAFAGAAGDVLVQALDLEGVAVSTGSACASGSIEPSPVLLAMDLSPERARASLRFSLGPGVDESQIDRVVALLPDLVERVRAAEGA